MKLLSILRSLTVASPDEDPPRLRALRAFAVEGAIRLTRTPGARRAPAADYRSC